MSPEGAVFNIGSQQAGAIYQAGGDQTIDHAGGTLGIEALSAVTDLRTALGATALDGPSVREVEASLDDIETELGQAAPDKGRIAGRLEGLIGVLSSAGALASAGESLMGPLRSLASWAGVAGQTALRLLA